MIDSLAFYCFTYPYGIISGNIILFLRIFGVVIIKNINRLPRWQKNMVIMPNHPSMLEPFIIPPALFFNEYLINPKKFGPISTPDIKNFGNWFFIKPWAIPIDRTEKGNVRKTLLQMIDSLKQGKRIIIFPEGGRTTGKTVNAGKFIYSSNGNKIKKLQAGISFLIQRANPVVLPVWISGTDKVLLNRKDETNHLTIMQKIIYFLPRFWRKIEIKVGNPFRISPLLNRKEIMELLTEKMIQLSDE
ncbi:lysophospholipid acyltransferase family protein [Patescibacteria group bacterium]